MYMYTIMCFIVLVNFIVFCDACDLNDRSCGIFFQFEVNTHITHTHVGTRNEKTSNAISMELSEEPDNLHSNCDARSVGTIL